MFIICPGAQKAGTTTLYNILKKHEGLILTNSKETKYFLKPEEQLSEKDYLNSHYINTEDKPLYGDIDPEYLYYHDIPRKIKNTLGKDVKFIIMLRNPADRAYSHYKMTYRRGFDLDNFEESLRKEEERLATGTKKSIWHYSYQDRGFYYRQISNYLNYFPINNMHFVIFEEFINKMEQETNEILKFLDLATGTINFSNVNTRANKGGQPRSLLLSKIHGQPLKIKKVLKILFPFRNLRWKIYPLIEKYNKSNQKFPPMKNDTRKQLIDVFQDDIEKLDALINKDLSHWLKIRTKGVK